MAVSRSEMHNKEQKNKGEPLCGSHQTDSNTAHWSCNAVLHFTVFLLVNVMATRGRHFAVLLFFLLVRGQLSLKLSHTCTCYRQEHIML